MTQRVQRFDRSVLPKAQRLDTGAIRAPARLTRTGVFRYVNADGVTVGELRLPEEVFSKESLASFELLPLVDDHHPEIDGGRIDSKNVRGLAVGAVAGLAQDGHFVTGMINAWDVRAVEKIESGKQEISLGYYCDREPAPAGATFKDPITGDSVPYHFIQRNIRGNHVALVQVGRAGPQVKILLDGSQETPALKLDNSGNQLPSTEKSTMEKITVDGVEFEVSTQIKQALNKALGTVQAKLDTASGERDALKTQVTDLQTKLDAANDPKAVEAKVTERLEIEKIATAHGLKADGKNMDAIKRDVITKLQPATKLDGMSADYVSGVFSMLTAKSQSVTAAIGAQIPAAVRADGGANQNRAQEGRERFFKQGQAEVQK